MNALLLALLAALAAAALFTLLRLHRARRRRAAIRALLDAADALEARLRTARSELEAVTGAHAQDPVHEAMREMLRQRLWLREHGARASLDELGRVRHSIDDARARIEQQLARIEDARLPAA